MRVLWISNIIFPEACGVLGIQPPVVGGWMQSGATALLDMANGMELGVVSFYTGKEMKIVDGKRIKYYVVPEHVSLADQYDAKVEEWLRQVNDDFRPDIVHIHGSEYGHSLAQVRACGSRNTVVSIQGLVSVYKNYYFGGMTPQELNRSTTVRDIVRRDTLRKQQKRMAERGRFEEELLSSVGHVIGRTSWDRSCVWAVNPSAEYHFCNETLRKTFYDCKWKYDECHKHRIFLSQGQYPIKGLHQVVKALPLVLRQYPDAEVYVAGNDFFSAVPLYRRNGYANYVNKLMGVLGISDKFHFLGKLTEQQMAEQYMMANVFVCPSAIENSPNSVGEAQLIGTPVVASYVGGTMDMVTDGETGLLYRFEEIPLLAEHICSLFADADLCRRISERERVFAAERHNAENNAKNMLDIYKDIIAQ